MYASSLFVYIRSTCMWSYETFRHFENCVSDEMNIEICFFVSYSYTLILYEENISIVRE